MTSAASPFVESDSQTVELLIQLQLADLEDIEAFTKGKHKYGQVTDNELACKLMKDMLHDALQFLADQRMARSITAAVCLDGDSISRYVQDEQIASCDRAFAHGLDTSTAGIPEEPVNSLSSDVLSRMAGLYVSRSIGIRMMTTSSRHDSEKESGMEEEEEEEEVDAAESSRRSPRRQDDDRALHRPCVSCRDVRERLDLIPAPCGHEYCRDCLQSLFTSSFSDESLFPPRCCRQAILPDQVSVFLTSEIRKQHEEKKIEYETLNRTYCSQPSCSVFIPAQNIENEVARCPLCSTQTCTLCKMPAHQDPECPNDAALQAVNDLALQNGWQRCTSCHRLIELEVGCNHITCVCRAEFCYRCGLPWKTCTCPQWEEHRLFARANQIVDRAPAVPLAMNDPLRQSQIQQAARRLRDRHHCTHERWTYVRGQHRCEECLDTLPQYIYECHQCQVRACTRCRRNRL